MRQQRRMSVGPLKQGTASMRLLEVSAHVQPMFRPPPRSQLPKEGCRNKQNVGTAAAICSNSFGDVTLDNPEDPQVVQINI